MDGKIVIKDPLYKMILVSSKHKKILNSSEFQRLRFVTQTAFASYVYPSANHTRFSHSLGCYHLMKKVLNNGLIEISAREKDKLETAALVHDIGHGPFSHIWERVFPHFDHDKMRFEILENMGLKDVNEILKGNNPYYLLLSSTLDVDKLDYMARDSYSCGVSYGMLEVDYILQHVRIVDGKLVIRPSSLSSVEDLITQRLNLFKVVYYHKTAIGFDFIFRKLMERVIKLTDEGRNLFMFDSLRAFIEKRETFKDLLSLNDQIMHAHFQVWRFDEDKILSDMCNRLLTRDKFKVINLDHRNVNVIKIKREVKKKYDLNYYFEELEIPIKVVQTPIYVEINDKLRKIEDVSDLVKYYKAREEVVKFVIFPRDIEI